MIMPKFNSILVSASLVLASVSALAQTPATTAPSGAPVAPVAPASHNTWWIIVLIFVVCGAIWYFRHVRPARSGTGIGTGTTGSSYGTTTTGTTTSTGSVGVDRDRVAGAAKQAKGALEEGAGKVLGDAKLQAEG